MDIKNNLFAVSFAVAISLFFIWPIKDGQLGVIDDHEIVAVSFRMKNLEGNYFEKVVRTIVTSEAGTLGASRRYRPIYYSLRIIKISIFHDNATAWFAVNTVLFCLALALFGLAVGRFFPWYVTVPAVTACLSLPMHRDLWARLGPAEIDAFFFTSCFIYALSRLKDRVCWAWPLGCVAAAAAIGCKENFLLLLLPLAVVAWIAIDRNYMKVRSLLWSVIPCAVATPVTYTILRTMAKGEDLYSAPTTISHILTLLRPMLADKVIICCLMSTVFLLCMAVGRKFNPLFRLITSNVREVWHSFYVSLTTLLIAIGNYMFYRGNIPWDNHYGFPFQLLSILAVLCVLYPLYGLFRIYAAKVLWKAALIGLFGLLTVICIPQLLANRESIKSRIQETQNFAQLLKESQTYEHIVLANPGGQVIESYEPYFSLKCYEAAGYAPSVQYFKFFAEPANKFQHSLTERLKQAVASQPNPILTPSVLLVSGMPLRRIEHSSMQRVISDLMVSKQSRFDASTGSIEGNTLLYIAVDDSNLANLELQGNFKNFTPDWKLLINDEEVSPENMQLSDDAIYMPISGKMREKVILNNLYKVHFVIRAGNGQAPLVLRGARLHYY